MSSGPAESSDDPASQPAVGWRALVEGLPLAAYEATAAGGLRWVSPRIEALVGHEPAALLSSRPDLWSLVLPADAPRLAEARARLTAPGDVLDVEYRLRRAGGDVIVVRDLAAACAGPEGALLLVGALSDASPSRRREAEAVRRARAATLEELSGGVAHEINNPLSGVLNYAQLALRLPRDDPKLEDALAGILAEGRRILELTHTLGGGGQRAGELRPLAPRELVDGALTLLRRRLRVEGAQVSLDVSQDLPPVGARGQELTLALHEVLRNAREALNARFPARDPQKRLSITARWVDEAEGLGSVEVEVRDGGAGMPAALREEAAAPFVGTHADRRGMGLTLAREAVVDHGGALEVEAAPEGGSVVRLRLPVFEG